MKVVIDVGCATYGGAYSIDRLLEEFKPDVLYGFDPGNEIVASAHEEWTRLIPDAMDFRTPEGYRVLLFQAAAWTYDGEVGFVTGGYGGEVDDRGEKVGCFDLARIIHGIPDEDEVILKIDAEGSEYELLDHLIDKGVDKRLSLVWVEWHDFGVDSPAARRSAIERRIACPMDEWLW